MQPDYVCKKCFKIKKKKMINIIKEGLDKAYENIKKTYCKDKNVRKEISIIDVEPLELTNFMKENNIPDDAEFSGTDNGYDGWNDIVLAWYVKEPISEKEIDKIYRKFFYKKALMYVPKLLVNNGYIWKQTGSVQKNISSLLYQKYLENDEQWLVEFFSKSYEKK